MGREEKDFAMRRIAGDDLPIISSCTIAAGITSAVFGAIDLQWVGAACGAVLGLFTGFLAGFCLSILAEGFLGVRADLPDPETGQLPPRPPLYDVRRWVSLLFQLAFMLAVTYEIFWLAHFQTQAVNHALALRLARQLQGKVDRAMVAESLMESRWLVAASTSRPLRWWLKEDYLEGNQAMLQAIDLLQPRENSPQPVPIPVPPQRQVPGELQVRSAAAPQVRLVHFQSPEPFEQPDSPDSPDQADSDARQNVAQAVVLAAEVCAGARHRLQRDLPKTLLLRFVPIEQFLGEL